MLLVRCINFNYVACRSTLLRNLILSQQYSKYISYMPENYYVGHFLVRYIFIYTTFRQLFLFLSSGDWYLLYGSNDIVLAWDSERCHLDANQRQ
jgi:hypothetical protein